MEIAISFTTNLDLIVICATKIPFSRNNSLFSVTDSKNILILNFFKLIEKIKLTDNLIIY